MKRFLFVMAVVAISGALLTQGIAQAEDKAPATTPAVKIDKKADTTATKTGGCCSKAAKTKSPIHSMMKWVGKHVMGSDACGCPSTAEGEKAWRAWFAGKDVKLASLRDAMVADGWNADKTIGYFKKMAESKKASGGCCGDKADGGCCGKCKDGGDCSGCDKDCPCAKKAKKEAEEAAKKALQKP